MEPKSNKLTLELDRELEVKLKIAARLKGVSVSQYCQSAIDERLSKDVLGFMLLGEFNKESIDRMAATRKRIFGGKRLPGDSADLLREAREIRNAQMDEWRGGNE